MGPPSVGPRPEVRLAIGIWLLAPASGWLRLGWLGFGFGSRLASYAFGLISGWISAGFRFRLDFGLILVWLGFRFRLAFRSISVGFRFGLILAWI